MMKHTTHLSQKIVALVLCTLVCLCNLFPAMAENIEKISLSSPEYFLVTGTGDSETETPVSDFSTNGLYRAKVTAYNYGDSEAVGAVLVLGLFHKNTGELLGVKFAKNDAIVANTTVVLSADIAVTDASLQTVSCYVWKSASTLKPLGNAAPLAPKDVTVISDKITNSTVELSWTASVDDTDSVAYYNVYRNGTYVGSTKGNETTFRDVGIRHNTEVQYAVEAVDAVGLVSEKSVESEIAVTDDIARIWFGAATVADTAADGTQITDENYTDLLVENGGVYNFNIVDVVSGEPSYDGAVTTGIFARSGEHIYANGNSLGFDSLDFSTYSSRILGTIAEEYMAKLQNEEEIKLVLNYFDNRVISGKENVGTTKVNDGSTSKSPTIVFKYANAADGSSLSGTTGFQQENSNKWKTRVMTIPTEKLTDGSAYTDVFSGRRIGFKTITHSGSGFAHTNGVAATFALGSNNGLHDSHFHNVILQKMELVAGDYVPYGAVIDFDNQEETQFVELSKNGTYHKGSVSVASDSNGDEKKAISLYGSENAYNKLYLGINSDYIGETDSDVIMRITYLDDQVDSLGAEKLTVVYQNNEDLNSSKVISRQGTGEWKTAEFFLEDAGFKNGLTAGASVQLGTSNTEDKAWKISRVEMIKR